MITSQTINEFLSTLPNEASRDGGMKEAMHDMLIGARNELERHEQRERYCQCPTHGGDEFTPGVDY